MLDKNNKRVYKPLMSNLQEELTQEFTALIATEREIREQLAKLAKLKRQLIIKLHNKAGLRFQQIADLMGTTTRASAERIFSGRKPKGK